MLIIIIYYLNEESDNMNKKLFKSRNVECKFTEDFMERTDKLYKLYKKGNLAKLQKGLPKLEIVKNIDKFIYGGERKDRGSLSTELNTVEKLITILKFNYENAGAQFMRDTKYDDMLSRYKIYRAEPIIGELLMEGQERAEAKTEHLYPELKGTLDKAKYMISDTDYGQSVEKYIERFVARAYTMGMKSICIRRSLKYDGTSVVLSFDKYTGKLLSAITRGKDNRGVDITHLFKGIKSPMVGDYHVVAIQCEIMMTNDNIARYSSAVDYEYKNSRGSVTSVITSLTGKDKAKYLDLVPIKVIYKDSDDEDTLLVDHSKVSLEGFNDIPYNSKLMVFDIGIKSDTIDTIITALTAESVAISTQRDDLGYQIDGMVIECMDAELRDSLGRKDSIDQFSVAYKFTAAEKESILRDVTYSVGRTGLVIPKAIYDEIIFNGTRQTKATLGSRANMAKHDLNLNDTVIIEYANDVIPYFKGVAYKGDGKAIKFPTVCPMCREMLIEEGAHSYCRNDNCESKVTLSYTNFMKALGYRNFSESFICKMYDEGLLKSYIDILNLRDYDDYIMQEIEGISYKKMDSYYDQTDKLIGKVTEDKILHAFGITGRRISKRIIQAISLAELLDKPKRLLDMSIDGLADSKKDIVKLIEKNKDQMIEVSKFLQPIPLPKEKLEFIDKVCFTGFRDKELQAKLAEKGIEVVSGFKNISYLVIPDHMYSNAKTSKAEKSYIPVVIPSELKEIYGIGE